MSIVIALGLVCCFALVKGLWIVKEDERLVVFRLGRLIGVLGPGAQFLIPTFDKAVRVELPKHVPEWRALSREEINRRAEDLALQGKV